LQLILPFPEQTSELKSHDFLQKAPSLGLIKYIIVVPLAVVFSRYLPPPISELAEAEFSVIEKLCLKFSVLEIFRLKNPSVAVMLNNRRLIGVFIVF
jgi:hypothetical protein